MLDHLELPSVETGITAGRQDLLADYLATDPAADVHTNFSVTVYADAATASSFATPDAAPSPDARHVLRAGNVVLYYPDTLSAQTLNALERELRR